MADETGNKDNWVILIVAVAGIVLTIIFGLIYSYAFRKEDFNFETDLDPYYFSLCTSYNAYGEHRPMTDAAKAVVMLQMTTSWIFLAVLAIAIYKAMVGIRNSKACENLENFVERSRKSLKAMRSKELSRLSPPRGAKFLRDVRRSPQKVRRFFRRR